MKRIQSKLYKVGTYDLNKISLSCFDDKRYVLGDGINTLAYFQKDIDQFRLLLKALIIIYNYKNHVQFCNHVII